MVLTIASKDIYALCGKNATASIPLSKLAFRKEIVFEKYLRDTF